MHTKVSQLLARLGRMFPGVSASVAPLGIGGRIMSQAQDVEKALIRARAIAPDMTDEELDRLKVQAREMAEMMVKPRSLPEIITDLALQHSQRATSNKPNPPMYAYCGRELPLDLMDARFVWPCGWPIPDPEAAGDGCPCELEEPGSG